MVEDIAARIRAARIQKGMSEKDLAKGSGVSRSMLNKMKSNGDVTVNRVVEIAKCLGVRPEWLLFGSGPETEQAPLATLSYPAQRIARSMAIQAAVPAQLLQRVDSWSGELYADKTVWYWLAAYMRHAGETDATPTPPDRQLPAHTEGSGPPARLPAKKAGGERR